MPLKKFLSGLNPGYRYWLLLFISIFCVLTVEAQKSPKFELYGGYSYVNQGMHGLNGEVTYNLNQYLGITADANGAIKAKTIKYSLMIGPEYSFSKCNPYTSYNVSKIIPFVHALFGVSRTRTERTNSRGAKFYFQDNSLVIAAGGGIDIKLSQIFAVRFTGDYLLTVLNDYNPAPHSFRVGAGLVLGLGQL